LSRSGVGDKFLLMLPNTEPQSTVGLLSSLNAFVFDYATRQKLGGTALKYFVTKQLPVLPPSVYAEPAPWTGGKPVADWLLPRVMELTYTAWDLQPFAADCGFDGPPFRWDEGRRFQLRCELDAAFLHLYLGTGEWRQAANEPDADFAALKEAFPTPRHAAEYILDTFPVVRQADEQKHQSYRTKEQILAVYDALAEAGRTGKPYRTLLDPPPADPRVAHPAKKMAPPPSRRDLQRRQAVAYIVLLLRTWEKPVTRSALEPALVLMLNDGVRHAILQNGSAPKPNEDRQGSFEYVRGLDALLTEMEVGRFIAHDTVRGQQVFRLGPQAPPTDKAPAEDLQRVRETLRALEILGEDRASVELHEIVNETYELLP
jgi:hypothetical protein